MGVDMDPKFKKIPIGSSEVIRHGKDALILAVGASVYPSMKAAEILGMAGIETTVVNVRFIKPIDEELISKLAREIPFVLTVEENVFSGSFGERVGSLLINRGIGVKIKNLSVPDEFVEHGSQAALRAKYHLDPVNIADEVSFLVSSGKIDSAPAGQVIPTCSN